MDLTLADENSLKTLEDYCIFLTIGILSLRTLYNIEVKAIEIGIMKEEMMDRAGTMIWNTKSLITHYENQLSDVLNLLPDDFNGLSVLEKLKQDQIKKAKSFVRKAQK